MLAARRPLKIVLSRPPNPDRGEQVAVSVGTDVEALLGIEHELHGLRAVRELRHGDDEHQRDDVGVIRAVRTP